VEGALGAHRADDTAQQVDMFDLQMAAAIEQVTVKK
jgi:hypothetical protein